VPPARIPDIQNWLRSFDAVAKHVTELTLADGHRVPDLNAAKAIPYASPDGLREASKRSDNAATRTMRSGPATVECRALEPRGRN